MLYPFQKRDSALDFFKDEVPYQSEEYATRLFTDRAEEIIRDHDAENPLFLYFAHLAVHRATDKAPFQVLIKYPSFITEI